MVRSLLDAGLPLQRVRRAVEHLQLSGDDLAGLRLVTDGSTVFACHDDGQVLDALRGGQLALFLSIDAVAAEVEHEVRAFREDRDAFVGGLTADGSPGGSPRAGRAPVGGDVSSPGGAAGG